MKKRELWLDYLRAFACILVTLGHLVRGFQDAAIIKDSLLASGFVQVIYHFHVHIFLFCSGYLFQKSFSAPMGKREYYGKKIEKCLDFIIVYILFSGVNYVIKSILSADVNSPVEHSFLTVLLEEPISQMWYLYAISVIMLCVPAIKTDRACAAVLSAAVCLKVVMCVYPGGGMPLPLVFLCEHGIWFVLGQVWFYKRVVLKKWMVAALVMLFFVFNVLEQAYGVSHKALDAVLACAGILASAELFRMMTGDSDRLPLLWKLISRYMLQIYLLHTICAAGIRIVLIKLGITNLPVHLVLGTVFSFAVPIFCAAVAERVRVFNIAFYPVRTVKEMRKK